MARPANLTGPTSGPRRDGRAQDTGIGDPYKRTAKLQEPTVCPQCGAVYHHGRWQWAPPPPGAHSAMCQACHRVNDDFPAGILSIGGRFALRHRDEIRRVVQRQEEIENPEHPFNRILRLRDEPDGIVVTTTDVHLPRRIGEALKAAYDGALTLDHDEDGYFLRARWQRDD